MSGGERPCSKCGGPRDTKTTSGMCGACEAAYKRAYRAAHPEKRAIASANVRRWYARNAEAIRAANAERTANRRREEAEARHARGLYTISEAAEMLGIATSTFDIQLRLGKITVTERFGKQNRPLFSVDEIERYRANHRGKYGFASADHPANAAQDGSDAPDESPYVYPVLGCPLLRYRALHRDGDGWLCVLCIRRAAGWRQILSLQTACADEASACALAGRLAGRGKEVAA